MAYGGGPKVSNPVLLGFVDEFMETNKAHYTTNKVGGSPVSLIILQPLLQEIM